MAITWSDVVAIAPELSTFPSGSQIVILLIVDLQIDDDAWLDLGDVGRRYLAAHLATMSNRAGVGGMVIAEALGPMSTQYGLPPGVRGTFAMTSYGIEFERLVSLLPASLGFVP